MIKDFQSIIKNKDFIYLWISQILSQITIQSMNFLLLTILFAKTGSSIATSFLWVAFTLPAILVGPFASATIDMVSKKKVLMTTNILQCLTIVVYALLHRTSLFFVFGAVFVYSFLNQFYVPAEASSLPSIIPKKNLPQANSMFFLTQQASTIIGFGVAGIIAQALGFANSLYLYASLLFIAFLSTTMLPKMKSVDRIPDSFEKAFIKFFKRIIEGYDYIKERKNIVSPYVVLLTMQVALAIMVVSLPRLAKEVFNISYNTAGLNIMVPAATGALFGSIYINRLIKKGWRKKKMIEFFLTIVVLAFLFLTFLVPIVDSGLKIIMGICCSFLVGTAGIGIVIPTQTFLQEVTPVQMRGRVFGNFWFLSTIVTVIPVIFLGTITELLGIKFLLFLMTGVCLGGLFISIRYGNHFLENGK